jgi:UDP-GlcNAc:undecaprenyl-phosphate GlcNAc-1-phosphate transferase
LNGLAIFLGSVAFGLPCFWAALRWGRSARFLDIPSGIKTHREPVPYTGGAALAAIFVAASVLLAVPASVVVGAVLIWFLGFVDDVRGISPLTKLVALVPPLFIGTLQIPIDPVPRVVAIVAGVVLLNAFNVIDGLDGLAGGTALIAFVAVALSGSALSPIVLVLAGASVAFLAFNVNPARLFLGDEGSLLLGYLLWVLPLSGSSGVFDLRVFCSWLLLWTFPLVNVAFVVVKRIAEGRPVLRGDRGHLYDSLNRRVGLRSTLVLCWGIAALGAVGSVVLGRGGG